MAILGPAAGAALSVSVVRFFGFKTRGVLGGGGFFLEVAKGCCCPETAGFGCLFFGGDVTKRSLKNKTPDGVFGGIFVGQGKAFLV